MRCKPAVLGIGVFLHMNVSFSQHTPRQSHQPNTKARRPPRCVNTVQQKPQQCFVILTYYCGEIKDTVAQRLLIYPSKTCLGCSSTVNLIEFNWSLNNSVRLCVGASAKPVSQDRLAHVMPVNISAFWLKKKMLEGNERNWSKVQKQKNRQVYHQQQRIQKCNEKAFVHLSVKTEEKWE